MEKLFDRYFDWASGIAVKLDLKHESGIGAALVYLAAAIGAIYFGYRGFIDAGIGGAIVFAVVGALLFGFLSFWLCMGVSLFLMFGIPIIAGIAALFVAGWIIYALWGVGAPG